MKKIVLFFLTAIVSITTANASDFNEGGMYFTITSTSEKTVEIACKNAYEYTNGYSGTVVIPTTVEHDGVSYTVTGIGQKCFSTCTNLTAVIIPEGIKTIGIDAFRSDYNLVHIDLPQSLETIGNMAFQGSGITEIVIPDKVQVVGQMTFAKCWGLSKITLGKGVHTIEQNAFFDTTGIQELTVMNPTPPQLNDRAFSNYNATLYVPAEALESYRTASVWDRFPNLLPIGGAEYETFEVTVKVSKSYVAIGETVTLSFDVPEGPLWGIDWTLPEGVEIVDGDLNSPILTVKATTLGQKAFGLTVLNTDNGQRFNLTKRFFDVLDSSALADITNVALNKTIHSFSGSQANNTKERPENLLDGDTSPTDISKKWCNDASNHWVVIDLESLYELYGFRIYDCKAGNENYDNIDKYRIQVSYDAEEWETVVSETGRKNDAIKTDFIAPTKARYIRFNPYDSKSFTIRVWEFEAMGIETSNNMRLSAPAEATVKGGESTVVAIGYDLQGDERAADFHATASTGSDYLSVKDITDDQENSQFLVTVEAAKVFGYATLDIVADNGGARKAASVNLTIDSEATDVAAAIIPDSYVTEGQLWTIVSAPATWNVAKLTAITANEHISGVSFLLSNDKESWTEVYRTNNVILSEPITYILPQYRETRHVAVVCTVSGEVPADAVSIQVFEQLPDGIKEQAPVAIASGWNADVIAEELPAQTHTNNVLDDQGWVLYAEGVFSEGGLPADGTITTNSGNVFQLANLTDNNAACLKQVNETVTLTFVTPQQASQLQLLTISANGESRLRTTVNYSDGTTAEETFTIADWFSQNSGQGEALYGLSRVITRKEADWKADDKDYRNQFRLFELSLDTDLSKVITSVSVTSVKSGSYPTILALSRTGHSVTTGLQNRPSTVSSSISGETATYDLLGRKNVTPEMPIVIIRGKKVVMSKRKEE